MIGAIFVDGASMSFTFKDAGSIGTPYRLDYIRLPSVLTRIVKVEEPCSFPYRCYYGAYRDEYDLMRRGAFESSLTEAGWSFFSIQAKKYFDGHYEDKGVDIALAIDAFWVTKAQAAQVLVVATHDSDFVELFRRVHPKVRRFVLGWEFAMAKELKKIATPIFLESIQKQVEYRK